MQIPQVFPKQFSAAVGELLSHNVVQLIINISGYDIIYDFNFPVVETYTQQNVHMQVILYSMCKHNMLSSEEEVYLQTHGYTKPVTLIKQLMYISVT